MPKTETAEMREARYKRELDARTDKYFRDMQRANAHLKRHAAKFPIPEGFVASWSWEGCYYGGKSAMSDHYVLYNEARQIRLIFRTRGSGTCSFHNGVDWVTYDRRGVSESFYWMDFATFKGKDRVKTPKELEEIYEELFARIEKSREYRRTAIPVPGIGFTVAPELLDTHKAALARNQVVTFHPSGFGTGYMFSKARRGIGRRASAEQEAFFGVSPLYIATMDCD